MTAAFDNLLAAAGFLAFLLTYWHWLEVRESAARSRKRAASFAQTISAATAENRFAVARQRHASGRRRQV